MLLAGDVGDPLCPAMFESCGAGEVVAILSLTKGDYNGSNCPYMFPRTIIMIIKKSISCRTSTCSQAHQQRLASTRTSPPIVSARND
jgi:hypothetical protein